MLEREHSEKLSEKREEGSNYKASQLAQELETSRPLAHWPTCFCIAYELRLVFTFSK